MEASGACAQSLEATLKDARSRLRKHKKNARISEHIVPRKLALKSRLKPVETATSRFEKRNSVDENSNDIVTSPGRGNWAESNPRKRFHFGAELTQVLQQWMVKRSTVVSTVFCSCTLYIL